MVVEGLVEKDGKFWIAEIPFIDVMTQGKTKKEAYLMAADAVKELLELNYTEVIVYQGDSGKLYLQIENDDKLLPFVLKRQRELKNLSLREVAKMAGDVSHQPYYKYETGKRALSYKVFQKYLKAISGMFLYFGSGSIDNLKHVS